MAIHDGIASLSGCMRVIDRDWGLSSDGDGVRAGAGCIPGANSLKQWLMGLLWPGNPMCPKPEGSDI